MERNLRPCSKHQNRLASTQCWCRPHVMVLAVCRAVDAEFWAPVAQLKLVRVKNGQQDHAVAQQIKASLSQWQRGSKGTKADWTDTWRTHQTESHGTSWYTHQGQIESRKSVDKPFDYNQGPKAKRPKVTDMQSRSSVTAPKDTKDTDANRTARIPLPTGLVPNGPCHHS